MQHAPSPDSAPQPFPVPIPVPQPFPNPAPTPVSTTASSPPPTGIAPNEPVNLAPPPSPSESSFPMPMPAPEKLAPPGLGGPIPPTLNPPSSSPPGVPAGVSPSIELAAEPSTQLVGGELKVNILISTTEALSSFEITLTDSKGAPAPVASVEDGLLELSGMFVTTSKDDGTVQGLSLMNPSASIYPGDGLLTVVSLSNYWEPSVCIPQATFSLLDGDEAGTQVRLPACPGQTLDPNPVILEIEQTSPLSLEIFMTNTEAVNLGAEFRMKLVNNLGEELSLQAIEGGIVENYGVGITFFGSLIIGIKLGSGQSVVPPLGQKMLFMRVITNNAMQNGACITQPVGFKGIDLLPLPAEYPTCGADVTLKIEKVSSNEIAIWAQNDVPLHSYKLKFVDQSPEDALDVAKISGGSASEAGFFMSHEDLMISGVAMDQFLPVHAELVPLLSVEFSVTVPTTVCLELDTFLSATFAVLDVAVSGDSCFGIQLLLAPPPTTEPNELPPTQGEGLPMPIPALAMPMPLPSMQQSSPAPAPAPEDSIAAPGALLVYPPPPRQSTENTPAESPAPIPAPTPAPSEVSLVLVDNLSDTSTIEVWFSTDKPIIGFNFQLQDELGDPAPILSAFGGVAQDAGFFVDVNAETASVAGFAVTTSLSATSNSTSDMVLLTKVRFQSWFAGVYGSVCLLAASHFTAADQTLIPVAPLLCDVPDVGLEVVALIPAGGRRLHGSSIQVNVMMWNREPVAGFQFVLSDENSQSLGVLSVVGGSAEDAQFGISLNTVTGHVVGFAIAGNVITKSSKHLLLAIKVDTIGDVGSVCLYDSHVGTSGGVPLGVEDPSCAVPDLGVEVASPPYLMEPPPSLPDVAEGIIQLALAARVDDSYKRDLFVLTTSSIGKLIVQLKDSSGQVASITSVMGGSAAEAGFVANLIDDFIHFSVGPTGTPISSDDSFPVLFTTFNLDPLSLSNDDAVCISSVEVFTAQLQSLEPVYFPCETTSPPPGELQANEIRFPPPPETDPSDSMDIPIGIPTPSSVTDYLSPPSTPSDEPLPEPGYVCPMCRRTGYV